MLLAYSSVAKISKGSNDQQRELRKKGLYRSEENSYTKDPVLRQAAANASFN